MSDENYEVEVDMGDDLGSGFSDEWKTTDQSGGEGAQGQQAQQPAGDNAGDSGDRGEKKKPRRNLKERVGELTRKYHDADRALAEERDARHREQQQFQAQSQQFQKAQTDAVRTVYGTFEMTRRTLEQSLRWARAQGDTAAEDKISEDLVDVRSKMANLEQHHPQLKEPGQSGQLHAHQQQPAAEQQQQQPATEQQPAAEQGQLRYTAAQRDWLAANEFIRDAENSQYVPIIAQYDQILRARGFNPDSREFFEELNKRLKQDLPESVGSRLKVSQMDEFADLDDDGDDDDDDAQQPSQQQKQQPSQQQAPSSTGMTDGGRSAPATRRTQKVKLSREDLAFCERNGISKEDFARQKANSGNGDYTYVN